MKLHTLTFHMILGFIGFIGLIVLVSVVNADEPDPKVILQQSAHATSALKSSQADIEIGTFTSLTPMHGVIYQKKMPDGMMAMRMEMEAPTNAISQGTVTVQKIYTLISAQGAYSVIGDKAIKMDGMPGMDKMKELMNPDAIKKLMLTGQSDQLNYTLTNGVVDGMDCWIISIPTTPAAQETVKKAMEQGPQKDLLAVAKIQESAIPIASKTVIYFDKETKLIAKQESIADDGTVIQSMKYQNVKSNPDLPDALFKLPDNIQVQDMSSMMQNLLKNLKPTNT